jgi:hypothetical protein
MKEMVSIEKKILEIFSALKCYIQPGINVKDSAFANMSFGEKILATYSAKDKRIVADCDGVCSLATNCYVPFVGLFGI